MFRQMEIVVPPSDCKEIFRSIDIDNSGKIQWAEFQHDFDKCVRKSVQELEAEEAALHRAFDDGPPGYGTSSGAAGGGDLGILEHQRRIASLEAKCKQAHLELQSENALRNLTEEASRLVQKHYDDLRKQFDFTRDEYFKARKKIKELEEEKS